MVNQGISPTEHSCLEVNLQSHGFRHPEEIRSKSFAHQAIMSHCCPLKRMKPKKLIKQGYFHYRTMDLRHSHTASHFFLKRTEEIILLITHSNFHPYAMDHGLVPWARPMACCHLPRRIEDQLVNRTSLNLHSNQGPQTLWVKAGLVTQGRFNHRKPSDTPGNPHTRVPLHPGCNTLLHGVVAVVVDTLADVHTHNHSSIDS